LYTSAFGALRGMMDLVYGSRSIPIALSNLLFWPLWYIYNYIAYRRELVRIEREHKKYLDSITPEERQRWAEIEAAQKKDMEEAGYDP
jgi:hypothetical protein